VYVDLLIAIELTGLVVIVHYVLRTFKKGQEDYEAVKQFIIYNFEEQIRLYPGQRIVILCDMTDAGIRNLVRLFQID
jgi:hypothetical protein